MNKHRITIAATVLIVSAVSNLLSYRQGKSAGMDRGARLTVHWFNTNIFAPVISAMAEKPKHK